MTDLSSEQALGALDRVGLTTVLPCVVKRFGEVLEFLFERDKLVE